MDAVGTAPVHAAWHICADAAYGGSKGRDQHAPRPCPLAGYVHHRCIELGSIQWLRLFSWRSPQLQTRPCGWRVPHSLLCDQDPVCARNFAAATSCRSCQSRTLESICTLVRHVPGMPTNAQQSVQTAGNIMSSSSAVTASEHQPALSLQCGQLLHDSLLMCCAGAPVTKAVWGIRKTVH